MKNKLAVVIIVGSNEISMRISQKSKNLVKTIENLKHNLNLGRDTFVSGSLSFENINKICSILNGYLKVISQYKVEINEIEAVGTTAIREAHNHDYVLDQIRIVTGLNLKIIDDRSEKLYNFQLIDYYANEEMKNSSIMVNIGSGNVALLHYENGKTAHFDTVRFGALRLSEILGHLTTNFSSIIDDYLGNFIKNLHYLNESKPKYFIASGHEVQLIASLCGTAFNREFANINLKKFNDLYKFVTEKSLEKISDTYDLNIEKVELLVAQVAMLYKILKVSQSEVFLVTRVDTIDAFTINKLYNQMFEKIIKEFNQNNLEAVRLISKKYKINKVHTDSVEKFALKIFDKMKKIHGMGQIEKKLLSTAAILHDIGKFVNYNDHEYHSYNLINGLDISILNIDELEVVANIALYHGKRTPTYTDDSYMRLPSETRVLISKLTAILRMADSLDKCEDGKVSDIDIKVESNKIVVTAICNQDMDLERWTFNVKSRFFEDVFGLKPIIKLKRV